MAGRRKVELSESAGWVFNRMADVYDARPAYPTALIDVLAGLAGAPAARVLEVGAGVGHVALPLAARGFTVTALEPARAMLDQLEAHAARASVSIEAVHATSEAMPCPASSFQLAVIADALHFLDAALTGAELRRVLAPRGALAIVLCELADTPFMRALVQLMEESAPRRPRAVTAALQQVAALAQVELAPPQTFDDETTLDHARLERILRSISFIGPAMNRERFARFSERARALSEAPTWARRFTLYAGRRLR
jgi:ubiquinone/menaquinone biosynthesis C-methylase UbiE